MPWPAAPLNGVGGGLGVRHSGFQYEGGATHHQVRVTGGWFLGNEARGNGGGMHFSSSDEGEDVQIQDARGGAVYFEDNAVAFTGGGFGFNGAGGDGGALAGRLLGYGAGMDPVATLTLDALSLHENQAGNGGGGAIHFNGYTLSATNVQVSENESATGPAVFGVAPGLVPSGATAQLSVDWQYVTVGGNWVSGGLQHSAGVTFWDPVAGAPGGATGFIDDSVIAFNHTPDPSKNWQVEGDQAVAWSNSISYAHDPVETNVALLVQTTGGGVTGTNPIHRGLSPPGNSLLNLDPWDTILYSYFDYRGDGPSGSPIVDPLSPTDDLIGAFAVGGAGYWCGSLVAQGCVPN